MGKLDVEGLKAKVEEINQTNESDRRARSKKRHDIYKDKGKAFLLEELNREFDSDALNEFRLAPINILKKIINKRSTIYNRPPVRTAMEGKKKESKAKDQALIDFYVEEWDLDQLMQKWNRYYNLLANSVAYVIPQTGLPKLTIQPDYLYSVMTEPTDPTNAKVYLFNSFLEEGQVAPERDVKSATGKQAYSKERGHTEGKKNQIESGEKEDATMNRLYITWSDKFHATLDKNGSPIRDSSKDDTQFENPLGTMPIVNLAKDRDAEFWAEQGEDLVDLSMAFMKGWSDLLTIAKHQGFSILTITSEEEPKNMRIGLNRAIWLKIKPGAETPPSIAFAQATSPIAEYVSMLMDLLGLTLSTNDMNPKEIGGATSGGRNFNSAFQAIIESADTLEARRQDMPPMKKGEKEMWQKNKAVHNWQFDQNLLRDDAKALGKFSDDFGIMIEYAELKLVESRKDILDEIDKEMNLGLADREDGLERLRPELSSEAIKEKLQKVAEARKKFIAFVNGTAPAEPEPDPDGNK